MSNRGFMPRDWTELRSPMARAKKSNVLWRPQLETRVLLRRQEDVLVPGRLLPDVGAEVVPLLPRLLRVGPEAVDPLGQAGGLVAGDGVGENGEADDAERDVQGGLRREGQLLVLFNSGASTLVKMTSGPWANVLLATPLPEGRGGGRGGRRARRGRGRMRTIARVVAGRWLPSWPSGRHRPLSV